MITALVQRILLCKFSVSRRNECKCKCLTHLYISIKHQLTLSSVSLQVQQEVGRLDPLVQGDGEEEEAAAVVVVMVVAAVSYSYLLNTLLCLDKMYQIVLFAIIPYVPCDAGARIRQCTTRFATRNAVKVFLR